MGDDNQCGIFNNAPNHGTQIYNDGGTVNLEDRSLKRRLRDLFARVDERIPMMLDQGQLAIRTRMSEPQFSQFETLCAQPGWADFVEKAERGPSAYMTIDNGSLGPTNGCHQRDVAIWFKRAISE